MLRDRIPQSSELHLSAATKQILFYANDESRQLKNRHIGPEHLLLGIVREEKSVAAELLFGYGLRLPDVREELSDNDQGPELSRWSDLPSIDEAFAGMGDREAWTGW